MGTFFNARAWRGIVTSVQRGSHLLSEMLFEGRKFRGITYLLYPEAHPHVIDVLSVSSSPRRSSIGMGLPVLTNDS